MSAGISACWGCGHGAVRYHLDQVNESYCCANTKCTVHGEVYGWKEWQARAAYAEKLRTHNWILLKALRFYADQKNYIILIKDKKAMQKFISEYGESVEADQGAIARKAMEDLP